MPPIPGIRNNSIPPKLSRRSETRTTSVEPGSSYLCNGYGSPGTGGGEEHLGLHPKKAGPRWGTPRASPQPLGAPGGDITARGVGGTVGRSVGRSQGRSVAVGWRWSVGRSVDPSVCLSVGVVGGSIGQLVRWQVMSHVGQSIGRFVRLRRSGRR